MGLYGALIVRPTARRPTSPTTTRRPQFDPSREYLLLLTDIDPDLHHAVETGGTYDFNASTTATSRSTAASSRTPSRTTAPRCCQPAVRRAGADPAEHRHDQPAPGADPDDQRRRGSTTRSTRTATTRAQIAQDGRLLVPAGTATTEHFGETIGSGQTEDFLLRWDDQDNWNPTTNPLPVAPAELPQRAPSRTATPGTAAARTSATRARCRPAPSSQNICGEWYFPLHSHALNEFTNFDQGFGGMGTLLRVDPPGGCFASPRRHDARRRHAQERQRSTALAVDDGTYYQVNPKTTTRPTAHHRGADADHRRLGGRLPGHRHATTSGSTTRSCRSPAARARRPGRSSRGAARHGGGDPRRSGAVVTALATDWYAGFTGVAGRSHRTSR